MASTTRWLSGLAIGAMLLVNVIPATAHAQTSGSISAETSDISDPMQANWIGCAILFQGKTLRCSLSGLQVPITGTARISGTVSNVKNVADVAGTYKVVGVDDTFGVATEAEEQQRRNNNHLAVCGLRSGNIDPQTVLQVGSDGMKIDRSSSSAPRYREPCRSRANASVSSRAPQADFF